MGGPSASPVAAPASASAAATIPAPAPCAFAFPVPFLFDGEKKGAAGFLTTAVYDGETDAKGEKGSSGRGEKYFSGSVGDRVSGGVAGRTCTLQIAAYRGRILPH